MKKSPLVFLVAVFLISAGARAQLIREGEGYEWKGLEFRAEAGAAASYDSRVVMLTPTEAADDFYGELSAGASVRNLPARYQFGAYGNYGYRVYNDFETFNDDFYSTGAFLGTDEGRLNWDLLADYTKRLSYDTAYNPAAGTGLDSILSNEPNIRFIAAGEISYDAPLSEKTSMVPAYSLTHYKQDFERSQTSAEWQIHSVSVPVKYAITEKTALFVGGAGSLQVNLDEDGRIGTVYAGAESRATEKTTYTVNVGYSYVDYELSGEDQGFVANARVVWRPTPKVNAYAFGGNEYEPGYGGGSARMVYRVGYGAGWRPTERWSLGAQVLHDYQQAIGDNANVYGDDPRHFINGRLGYQFTRWAEAALVAKYVIDQVEVDQAIVSIRLDCRF